MTTSDESGLLAMDFATASRRRNLPVKLTRLIGRLEIIDNLAQRLSMQRLLTIVGSGGIGKTAVALDVAEETLFSYAHGAWLIDLARIAEPRPVPQQHSFPRLVARLDLTIRSLA